MLISVHAHVKMLNTPGGKVRPIPHVYVNRVNPADGYRRVTWWVRRKEDPLVKFCAVYFC